MPQGPRACRPKALSLRLPRVLLDNAMRGHLRSGIQHFPCSHLTHCSQAPRLSQRSHPDSRPRPGGLNGRRERSQEPACWGHGFPCSSQAPGHPRPRGGSTVCPGCFPSRQNTVHRQGQAPRTQRPGRAPITQAGPGLDQRADADPSGRENEPQWGQLVGSTKAPWCLIFRSRVHVSEGQDKKGGFTLTQSR